MEFEASNFTQVPVQPSCEDSWLKPCPLSNELSIVTAMVAPTDREKSFSARNGDPYRARRLFSKPHDLHKRSREMAYPCYAIWAQHWNLLSHPFCWYRTLVLRPLLEVTSQAEVYMSPICIYHVQSVKQLICFHKILILTALSLTDAYLLKLNLGAKLCVFQWLLSSLRPHCSPQLDQLLHRQRGHHMMCS